VPGPNERQAEPPRRRARLVDVAQAAGVHISTVSRVVNDQPITLPPETRERILRAARELRYRPQAAGRMLRLASAGAFGLLVPSLRNPVWATVVHGAIARGNALGLVGLIAEDTGDGAQQLTYERLVSEGRIDGLIVCSAPVSDEMLEHLSEDDVPVVFANRGVAGSGRNIVMDEEGCVRLALEHLVGRGHRRIVQIDGPPTVDTARRRLAGFEASCRDLGVQGRVVSRPFEEAPVYEATLAELSAPDGPTALIVSNINQLLGALAAFAERGMTIGEDVALMSYDEDDMLDYLAITSIAMPLTELGAAAVDALADQIETGRIRDIVLDEAPRLIARRSTERVRA
jgi:DNA-binding LacI/PurR family transcriptional regulator